MLAESAFNTATNFRRPRKSSSISWTERPSSIMDLAVAVHQTGGVTPLSRVPTITASGPYILQGTFHIDGTTVIPPSPQSGHSPLARVCLFVNVFVLLTWQIPVWCLPLSHLDSGHPVRCFLKRAVRIARWRSGGDNGSLNNHSLFLRIDDTDSGMSADEDHVASFDGFMVQRYVDRGVSSWSAATQTADSVTHRDSEDSRVVEAQSECF